jgi:glucose-6-phosphate dehydrogenase-like protein
MHEQGFKASCTGLVPGMPPEPCVVVILGVAGGLVPLFCARGLDAPPAEDYATLRQRLQAVQAAHQIPDNVLWHFSVPPLYGDIAHKLAAAALLKSDSGGWRRLIQNCRL